MTAASSRRRGVALAVAAAGVLALALVAGLAWGVWYAVHAGSPDDDQVVRVDATVALEPVADGTRVQLTLRPVGAVDAPVHVVPGTVDEAYAVDVPTGATAPGDVPEGTGADLLWTSATSAGRPLARAEVGFEPLRRNGDDYEMTALAPSVDGRRVVVLAGLGQFLDVRTLTVTSPPGALTSCLLTVSQSPRRAHRVTPCTPATSLRPELPAGFHPTVAQGEQQVRLELRAP